MNKTVGWADNNQPTSEGNKYLERGKGVLWQEVLMFLPLLLSYLLVGYRGRVTLRTKKLYLFDSVSILTWTS